MKNQIPTAEPDEASPMRVLNVEIPESEYWHIRKCATESRMSMKEFMAEFCKTATPIIPDSAVTVQKAESEKATILESQP